MPKGGKSKKKKDKSTQQEGELEKDVLYFYDVVNRGLKSLSLYNYIYIYIHNTM